MQKNTVYSKIIKNNIRKEKQKMLEKVENKDIEKIRNLFKDIRFYMGNSVLDGVMGEAYTDDKLNPNFAILNSQKILFYKW